MLFLLWFWISAVWASWDVLEWDDSVQSSENNNSSLHARDGALFDSGMIEEWTPVSSTIVVGQRDYFNFQVNSSYSRIKSSSDMMVFLSGNIVNQSRQLFNSTEMQLAVYYAFDESAILNLSEASSLSLFQAGYLGALALLPLSQNDNTTGITNLYLSIGVYNTTSKSLAVASSITQDLFWNYTISVSQYDLVFQWDTRSWIEVVDSDYNSALLVTGNVTETSSGSNYSIYDTGLYDLYLYSSDDINYFDNSLTNSLSAIQNGPYLATSAKNVSIDDGSGIKNSSILAIDKSISVREGSVKEQFHVTGLNSSTTYAVYLTKKISDKMLTLSSAGGVLFSKSTLTTMHDDSCSLIFDLDFCDGVAYSVPTSSLARGNKTAIALMYDNIAESLYANFSKALQIVPCDTEQDALYTPLRSCDDCAEAYRNWLCAVSIPRCTTVETSFYIHRDKTENRNDYLNQEIQPLNDYYEVLPCIDMCHSLVTDCPPDFQFSCPSKSYETDLMYQSYNVFEKGHPFDTCNFVGSSQNLQIVGS
ncbi:LANO_0H01178g1_1 [Lachancea nothofagi CBS 11611]|uniref:LANO_0H01178g1_1 n=1 Tax=Lachancea nothofagi CBS 11611 TaxID=1266666 RepID=A0A1G4KKR6_9SACH|nr:LANO_0H01178g1_1 [Lachancea nothofagi CBS 11611]